MKKPVSRGSSSKHAALPRPFYLPNYYFALRRCDWMNYLLIRKKMSQPDAKILNREKLHSSKKNQFYLNDGTFVRAAFSLDVYRDAGRPPLPDGWQILCDCPSQYQVNGYFGSAYYIIDIDEAYGYTDIFTTIIIAHRGTANIKDGYEDLIYLFDKKDVPPQFYSGAYPFIQYVINYTTAFITDLFGTNDGHAYVDIGFTGHSLGATLAEISLPYAFSNISNLNSNPKIAFESAGITTFESPGSQDILQKMLDRNEITQESLRYSFLNIMNADVNAINSCMSHLGDEGYLGSCPIPYSWIPLRDQTYPIAPTFLYFFWNFTVKDQHSMQKMYDYWSNGSSSSWESSSCWPSSSWEGYHWYLTYGNQRYLPDEPFTNHVDYWEGNQVFWAGSGEPGYIQRVWDSHPEIQLEYPSYSAFHDQYVADLQANTASDLSFSDTTLTSHELFEKGWQELKNKQRQLEKRRDKTGSLTLTEQATLSDYYKMENEYRERIMKILSTSSPNKDKHASQEIPKSIETF